MIQMIPKLSIENNRVYWFLFLLAVVVKATLLRTYLFIDGDRGLQVVAALEMAKGNGYTIPVVELSNINVVTNKVLLEWPPMYSALVAGFLETGMELVTASMLVDALGASLYLLGTLLLARMIGLPKGIQLIAVWFKATEIYEGIYSSPPTDIISTAFIFFTVYFFLEWLDKKEGKYILLTALSISVAFLLRYIYVTSLFVFPLLLVWNGWKQREKIQVRAGLFLALLVGISMVAYLGFNKYHSGHFTYLEEWEKGYFPRKAFNVAPLFWQAISHVTFLCMQFSLIFKTHFSLFHNFLKLTSTLILALLLSVWALKTKAWKLLLPQDRVQQFFLSAIVLCIPFVLVLLYLSITVEFTLDDIGWSYLIEDRYFLFPLTIILLAICHALYSGGKWSGMKGRILRWVFLGFFVLQVTHTIYIIAKRAPLLDAIDPAFPEAAGWSLLYPYIHEGKSRGNDVVLFSNGYGYAFFAYRQKLKLFRMVRELEPGSEIRLSRPTTIIFDLHPHHVKELAPFLEKYGFQPRRVSPSTILFVTHLKPGTNG